MAGHYTNLQVATWEFSSRWTSHHGLHTLIIFAPIEEN